MAELLVKIDPKLYRKYLLLVSKGKPVIYVQLKKALYGTQQVALLFWKKLTKKLKEWGFESCHLLWWVEVFSESCHRRHLSLQGHMLQWEHNQAHAFVLALIRIYRRSYFRQGNRCLCSWCSKGEHFCSFAYVGTLAGFVLRYNSSARSGCFKSVLIPNWGRFVRCAANITLVLRRCCHRGHRWSHQGRKWVLSFLLELPPEPRMELSLERRRCLPLERRFKFPRDRLVCG
jgi:hypothetical protein